MKQEKIHDALSSLDQSMVQQTDALRKTRPAKKNRLTRWIAIAASICIAATSFTVWSVFNTSPDRGGSGVVHAADLMEGIKPNRVNGSADLSQYSVHSTDFALRLFKASAKGKQNTLISPLSVLSALSMTANGADGQTLAQMEQTLGMTTDRLNDYFYSYMSNLPSDKNGKLSLANSIWFADDGRITVNPTFLQTNADYYGAHAYKAPFDSSTVDDINNWVNTNTDGMIPEILDEIPRGAVMYLVNALAFDAEWQRVYEDVDIVKGIFNTADGKQVSAEYMTSVENTFIKDDNAKGFIKYYKGNKYAFAALLPDEGVSLSDYINSLDGQKLSKLLSTRKNSSVYVSLPKFESRFDIQMSDTLKGMGMTDAFDGAKANFSRMGSAGGNIYINRVIHKTFISVGEKGTKAGAATLVEAKAEGAIVTDEYVCLDRPFVYMLIDCQTNTPFFIGSMNDISK